VFSAEVVIAAALLLGPKDIPVDPAIVTAVRPQLVALAISAEILDPREKTSITGLGASADLAYLQGRWHDFLDVPKLGMCEFFPERKQVTEWLAFNRTMRADLVHWRSMGGVYDDEFIQAISETDRLYQVWDTVRDARCEFYYVTVRRQALQLLRELIGDEAFYAGRMPPPVPVRHLPRR
jgi:hypothetical protein